jgi:ubiquinone/menaquinone biosynthesis C-methylase UbiE
MPQIKKRAQVDTGFLGINWKVKTLSLRFYRYRPLSRALAWWELQSSPKMTGPRDLSDLLAPGQEHAANLPYYYLFNPVHRMSPDGLGWMHPRMGRRYERMSEDFTYASYENIKAWIQAHVIEGAGITNPKRIIDLATGTGVNAAVYAELFPNAEVIGIDLAPSLLRWARKRAEDKGLKNLHYYHMDCADLSLFPDDHFDVVHEGMALHEMPKDHIQKTVREMVRVARPDGFLGFSDWRIPDPDDATLWRKFAMQSKTLVEPFMLEYARTNWPERLAELGCYDITLTDSTPNSAAWRARKGLTSNQRLAETAGQEWPQSNPPALIGAGHPA